MAGICSMLGCGKNIKAKGYCVSHYRRLLKHGHPLAGNTIRGLPQKYISDVILKYDGDDCISWPFSRDTYGYGQVRIDGKLMNVHRYVCLKVNGGPPDVGYYAAHECGKGHEGCVSKRHLSWKTPKENQDDRIVHGTRNVRLP